jgi:Fe-S-cluster containining protein
MTVERLFETRLCVDYWINADESNTLCLSPASSVTAPGTMMSFSAAFGPQRCMFLTDDLRCEIHPVKPLECREAMPCDPRRDLHGIMATLARNPAYQDQIHGLLKIESEKS